MTGAPHARAERVLEVVSREDLRQSDSMPAHVRAVLLSWQQCRKDWIMVMLWAYDCREVLLLTRL